MATSNISSSPHSMAFLHGNHRRHHPLPFPPSFSTQRKSDRSCGYERLLLLQVKCLNEPSRDVAESEPISPSAGSSGISSYSWCAGLGGLGFLETSYLTYSKLTGSDAFCPIGGDSCGDILNSNYSVFYGIPLPLIGMVAYGAAALLALKLAAKDLPFGLDESNGGLVLLGTTTAMSTANAYLLYILSTQFPGASCSYCLSSVLLSFSLFFTTAKILGRQKIREVGLQLCVAGLVFATLSNSYSTALPPPERFGQDFLPNTPTEIKTLSSPLALKLATHLRAVGAKLYGAFWCSHCLEQKQMFGREAANILDYVECYPDGYQTGTDLGLECKKVKIEGFPMWLINGQVLKGVQEFSDLAEASGFEAGEFSQELAKQSAEANIQP